MLVMSLDESAARTEEQSETVEPTAAPVFPMRYLRFGEFQLDLQREELVKNGERVRLQGKVYQTLLILLHRAGDVVTRDEVRRHLWPDNPQVNFDANVNTSMNKLRQALGDSPEKPAYIETIPRKGYCFLVKVDCSDTPLAVATKAAIAAVPIVTVGEPGLEPRVSLLPSTLSFGLRVATLVLAGMIVGALLVLAWFSYARTHRTLHSWAPDSSRNGARVSRWPEAFTAPRQV
jgi:DNA-binding winged helix-turn-helix (wHTH) protein